MNKLKPIHNRVLVRRAKAESVTRGGIVVPDNAKQVSFRGEVLALSDGKRTKSGEFTPHDFKVGDVIVFEKFADTDLSAIEPDLCMVEGDDILGVEERSS